VGERPPPPPDAPPRPTAPTVDVTEVEDPDESVDITGDAVEGDPEEAALALLQGKLGAQVIGEIDQS
jgi:hypothetical protein